MEHVTKHRPWRGTLSSHPDFGADLRRRTDCAAAGIVSDLSGHGVFGMFAFVSFDLRPVVWLQTATDAQRDALPLVGTQEVVERRLADQGVTSVASPRVLAQSQESVDRDFAGEWRRATN